MRAASTFDSGSLWRRVLTALVAAIVPVAGLAAPAQAAVTGSVTVVSTNGNAGAHASSNTTGPTVVITTSHRFAYTSGVTEPTITFSRAGSAGTDTVPFTITGGSGGTGTADSFTGTVDFNLANPGDYDISVSGASTADPDTTDSCTSCFQVLGSAPVLISTDTPALAQGGSATVTLSGSRFARGNYPAPSSNYACSTCTGAPTLEFRPTGTTAPAAGITLSDPKNGAVAATATTITKVVSVSGTAAVGSYDIYVENTDGKSSTLVGGLTVEGGLDITGVTPSTRGRNSTGGEIVVTGSHFPSDISGTISASGVLSTNGLTYGFVRDSASQVRFTNVDVSSSATLGARTITLTSASRHAAVTDSSSFSVTAAPSLSSVDATDSTVAGTYGQGADHVQLVLNGSGFVSGAQLDISPAAGITVNSTDVTASTITADISIDPSAATGDRAVSVVNGDGGRPTSSCGSSCTLSIDGAPTITSVDPNHGARGSTVSVTIKGTNLADGTTKSTPDITFTGGTVSNIAVVNATTVTADLAIDSGAVGSYDLAIKNNDDQGQGGCTGCFTADTLGVTDASASSALNDHVETGVVVTGTGFASDAEVELVKTGTGSADVPPIPGVVTTAPTESSPGAADGTSLTADFDLTGVDPGTYEFRVTNPGGGPHAGSGQGFVFTVVAVSPAISSVSPNSRGGGAVDQTVVISGSDFAPGATVAFSNPAVHIDSMSVDSSSQITVAVHVDQISSNDGSGTVTVTNTDNNSDSASFSLVVGPTITGGATVTQAQGAADVAFQLTGDQGTFPSTADAHLTATGSGVSFSSVTVTPGDPGPVPPASDDQLDAMLHVTQSAGIGAHDVVLVDAGTGGRDVCEGCVVVTSGPTVDAVTPGYGKPGDAVTVNITGSDFQADATVDATNGITVSNVSPAPNSIRATFTVPGGATPGSFADVTVTNPSDGGSQTLSSAFEVVDVPDAPTAVSATPGDSSADVSWTAPSANGGTIDTYTVTAQPTSGSAGEVSQSVTGNPAATNLTVTGLTNGVEYTFVVVATNEVGTGPTSDPSAPVTPVDAPAKVTGVTATAADGSANVSWTAPSDNGAQITKYTVTAVSPTSPTGDVTRTVNGTPAATHVTVDGLTNGTEYRFKVYATNSGGDGPESDLSSPITPTAASTLTIAKSAGRIVYGSTVTVSGTLTETVSGNPLAGETVELYGRTRPSSTFSLLGQYTTGADGNWSADVAPHRFTVFYAKFAGAGAQAAATSGTTKVRVAFKIRWLTPKRGDTVSAGKVVVKAQVRDRVVGAQGILLMRKANGHVVRLDTAKVNRQGRLRFVTHLSRGTYRIAVKVKAKGGCAGNTTRFIRIHVG